ncbi:fungal hydrophobin-domain-containing protein [Infundibulicybe gibba]|nr:fungal hydrophobin-domain-containing protein [Infundibulicybe gibba]
MLSRISFVTLSALAVLATATNHPVTTTVTVTAPAPTGTSIPASQCNVSGLQCCNSVGAANSSAVSGILALLGVVVQDVTALVGVTCSPITAAGIAGNQCSAQPVCCSNNDFHGVVAIGCTPINVNL